MKHTRTKGMAWVAVAVLALSAGSAMAGKRVTKKEITGVVNLNTATAQQLDLLPGIGEKAAKLIIEHRNKTPFAKVDDLRKVKGFGPKKMEKLKAFLTTAGPTTVAVKKATAEAKAGTDPAAALSAQGRRAQHRRWADDEGLVTTVPAGVDVNDPLLKLGFLDVTKPPYNADNTGVQDVTAQLQQAVREARDNQLVVFLSSGTYKVSDTIHCIMEKDGGGMKRWLPTYILGSRKGARPKIVLANGSAGFGTGEKKSVVWFQSMDNGKPASKFNQETDTKTPNNYNHTLRWVEVVTGDNPGAVGVRMGAAQGAMMEDVVINATGGFAGIYDSPGQGGGTYNVEVTGGQYGAWITDDSRFLMMAGCRFSNQTKAGVSSTHYQPIVLAGCYFEPAAGAVGYELHQAKFRPEGRNANSASVTMVDTVFNIGNNQVAVSNPDLRNIYLRNVSVSANGIVARNGATDVKVSALTGISEYAYTTPATTPAGAINLIDGVLNKKEIKTLSAITSLPTYDAVKLLHTWAEADILSFEDANVYNARDYGVKGDGTKAGGTDDTAALQALINKAGVTNIFLPKGIYRTTDTITLQAHTKLFGIGRHYSILIGKNSTTATKNLVTTVDSATGTGSISFLHLNQDNNGNGNFQPLVWRLGRNSMVHAVTVDDWNANAKLAVHTDAKCLWVTGAGGGRWFGTGEDWTNMDKIGSTGFRSLYVENTTEPLSIYGYSVERLPTEPMAEVTGASNVRFFYIKTESGMHPPKHPDEEKKQPGGYRYMNTLRINHSNNVAVYSVHGNAQLGFGKGIVDARNSTNVLVTQVRSMANQPRREDWNTLNETDASGKVLFSVPYDTECNVFKRGNFTSDPF